MTDLLAVWLPTIAQTQLKCGVNKRLNSFSSPIPFAYVLKEPLLVHPEITLQTAVST
jgi:hypothetical protein